MALLARVAPRRFVQQALAALPPPDQAVLVQADRQEMFLDLLRDTQRTGPAGAQHDMALMASPWDFDPAAVRAPALLWHGAADHNATVAMAQHLDTVLPNSTLTWEDGDGHLSIVTRHARPILGAIADHRDARDHVIGGPR